MAAWQVKWVKQGRRSLGSQLPAAYKQLQDTSEALAPQDEGCEFQGWISWGSGGALTSDLTGAAGNACPPTGAWLTGLQT